MNAEALTPSRRATAAMLAGLLALCLAFLLAPAPASAAPPKFWDACGSTAPAGQQCTSPRGIAANPDNGRVYVADGGNARVIEFSAWGEFLRTWGWGVVASGPNNDPQNEIQEVSVDATSGSFTLRYFVGGGSGNGITPQLEFDSSASDLQAALEGLNPLGPGDVSVSGSDGGPWAIEFTGALADKDIPRMNVVDSTLSGPGTVSVTTIQEGANFEVCVPAEGDECRAGQPGASSQALTFEPSLPSGKPGQLRGHTGIAVDSAGDVYVFDRANLRMQKFEVTDSDVAFEWTAGADVVATGPNNGAATAEVQTATVAADSGTFTLAFRGETTGPLDFDAPASGAGSVQEALNAISAISGPGGSVNVTGGPGDATGSSPYEITFAEALGGYDVPQISIGSNGLGVAAGTSLTCDGGPTGGAGETTVAYQWLSDGAPATGAGASTDTYTVDAADAGSSIQCRVTATHTAGTAPTASIAISTTRTVATPFPATSPPRSTSAPFADQPAGGFTAGATLSCSEGSWAGTVDTFAFQWYRNGVPLAGNGAETDTYTLQAADLATAATFQCVVTATNAGGSVSRASANRNTQSPAPAPSPNPPFATAVVEATSFTATTTEGEPVSEVCVPADGDVCKEGAQGSGPGEFDSPALGDYLAVETKGTASVADDDIWVGDAGRIQSFDTAGQFQDECTVPGTVEALDVDSTGDLYLKYSGEARVRKMTPPPACELLETPVFELRNPNEAVVQANAVTVDPAGEVYAFGPTTYGGGFTMDPIFVFDAAGNETERFGSGVFNSSSGLAVNPVTEAGDLALYVPNTNISNGFVRAYSPVPDTSIAGDPPPAPPTIAGDTALSVGIDEATVGAKINPHFWEDTAFYVEFGTDGPCSEVGNVCEDSGSPTPLGAGVTSSPQDVEITLSGLEQKTTYHFRFVAQSGGDPGPVFGADRIFRTHAPEPAARTDCPNQAFRVGPGALLPECRAYEMVSPVDKIGNAQAQKRDATNFEGAHLQATPEGDKLTYNSANPFPGARASVYSNALIASRSAQGWSTQAIDPPRDHEGALDRTDLINTFHQYTAFAEDLSFGWLHSIAQPPPDPAAPEGLWHNLFRHDIATDEFTALYTNTPEPPADPLGLLSYLGGFSADGKTAAFFTNGKLLPEASDAVDGSQGGSPISQAYSHTDGEGLSLVSRLPGTNAASDQPSAIGGGRMYLTGAVSDDGQRIYWTTGSVTGTLAPIFTGDASGRVYLRQGGTSTVAVSESVSAATARFWVAAKDGSEALFSFTAGAEQGNLYRFDVAAPNNPKQIAGQVGGVIGASEDLSRVYLVSGDETLDTEPNSEGRTAQAGEGNIYLYEAAGEEFTYVATADAGSGLFSSAGTDRKSLVTPDGGHLSFAVRSPGLTDYNNAEIDSGIHLREVYRFSAAEDELSCVSCNPTGARPSGQVGGYVGETSNARADTAAWVPGYRQGAHHAQRYITDDGKRVYFDSFESLLPRDTNGSIDVYEWRAEGVGGCEAGDANYFVQNKGCLSLMSTGKSTEDSEFIEASADGSTVFIRTSQSLVAQDPDLRDIYAVRVGGGFPQPPPDPAACEGEACRGASPGAPGATGAASAAFEGPGDRIEGFKRDCSAAAKRATRLNKSARALRKRARVAAPKRAKRLRKRAAQLTRKGKAQTKSAKRCRRANRRATR